MPNHTLILVFSAFLGTISAINGQNDTQVLGDAVYTPYDIVDGAEVTFLIRFQNLGLDTANNIVIRDTLDPRFDANTFYMLDASHNYQLLRDQGFIRWYFEGIRLPSADHSEEESPNSTGYVLFSVEPHRFLTPGQTILNRACITFDNADAACTEPAAVWIDEGAVAEEPGSVSRSKVKIVPNPNFGRFEVQKLDATPAQVGETVSWWISDMNGKTIWDGSTQDVNAAPNEVMLEKPAPGLYMLWMKENNALKVEQFAVIR